MSDPDFESDEEMIEWFERADLGDFVQEAEVQLAENVTLILDGVEQRPETQGATSDITYAPREENEDA